MIFLRPLCFALCFCLPSLVQAQSRPPWTTSRITGAPEPPRPYITEPIFPSLAFDQPVELLAIPGTSRLLVLEVAGKIYSFENKPDAETIATDLFADIKQRDPNFSRLYGFAFHPRFLENRTCFISYVLKDRTPDGSRVSRFKVSDSNPPRLIPDSEEIILHWYAGGHNGAHLQFGPEGCLYVSTGDAGDAFPPDGRNTGQDISDLEASILRIDVDRRENGRAYAIPPDNPFVSHEGARGEVWCYGLRNPWKIAFDPADGSLWAGDVGWELWEMIYRCERGANYGWSVVEGPQPVHQERSTGPTPIQPPAVAHSHIESRSITGGYFSQSPRLPDLRGVYIYGDYVTGKIWGLKHDGPNITWREELVDTPLQIVSFGLDHAGDVLIVDHPSGTLHRLAPNPRRGVNENFPRRLSETGLFADTSKHIPTAGVVPYRVTAELWSDGAIAERFIALPGDAKLGTWQKTNAQIGYFQGDWQFPDGSVLAKTLSLELEPGKPASRRRVETQILHYDVDTWKAYNYIWNEDQTDAVLADNIGTDRAFVGWAKPATILPAQAGRLPNRQTWHHASRTECHLCHTTRVGVVLGFKPQQLANLSSLEAAGLFAEPAKITRPVLPNPHDESAPLEARARAYLHVNCGHCHTRGGGGSSFFDVQNHLTLARTGLIGSRPTQGTFGIADAQIIAPGDPYRSILYYRISKLGHGRMPQFGSSVFDQLGSHLLRKWIIELRASSTDEKNSRTPIALDPSNPKKALDTPGGALQLSNFIEEVSQNPSLKQLLPSLSPDEVIAAGYAHPNPAIRDLFERFIPEEQRLQRLGGAIKPAEILALPGDAARGRALFFEAAGVQCKNCHKIGDQGQTLGPDLSQIAKKLDKPKLLESILEPSKTIDPQFVSQLVETTSGEVHCGLLVRRTDAETTLKLADSKEITIPAAAIERSVPQQKSLMPELLLRDMTAQQAADLLEFLSTLRGP
jgi:putative heme-binding domain-containing protein